MVRGWFSLAQGISVTKFKERNKKILSKLGYIVKQCFLSVFVLLSFHGSTLVDSKTDSLIFEKVWYVSTSIGLQMSGIKNEDFISENVAN